MISSLIVSSNPKSPISEAYRSIRTSIQFANVDKNIKTIMVTSATAGEGKSTTLANLALTLADAGSKILLLDCDLRKPNVHKEFEISNVVGLTDILMSRDSYRDFVNKDVYKNLDVITSGKVPKNPSEILYSKSMKNLIESLKADYDYVLIDAPPILPVTDAVIMASYLDSVLIVCASKHVDVEAVKRAKNILVEANAKILGVVLNKIPINEQKYSSYYYYYSNEKDE